MLLAFLAVDRVPTISFGQRAPPRRGLNFAPYKINGLADDWRGQMKPPGLRPGLSLMTFASVVSEPHFADSYATFLSRN
jgi:hypothetical protein